VSEHVFLRFKSAERVTLCRNRFSRCSECPSGSTTHPLRKWAIMNQLDAGMPKELLSDRVDVS
jgi:hypothetical protein